MSRIKMVLAIVTLCASGCAVTHKFKPSDRNDWENAKEDANAVVQEVQKHRIGESTKVGDLSRNATRDAKRVDSFFESLDPASASSLKESQQLQKYLLAYQDGIAKLVVVALSEPANYKFAPGDRASLNALVDRLKESVEAITGRITDTIEAAETKNSEIVGGATVAVGVALETYWVQLDEKARAAAKEAESAPDAEREAKQAIRDSLRKKADEFPKAVLVWLRLVQEATSKALEDGRISTSIIDSTKLNSALKQVLQEEWKPEYSAGVSVAIGYLNLVIPSSGQELDSVTKAGLTSLRDSLEPLIAKFSTAAPG